MLISVNNSHMAKQIHVWIQLCKDSQSLSLKHGPLTLESTLRDTASSEDAHGARMCCGNPGPYLNSLAV